MKVALVPGVLALRPEYASLIDPVAELRSAVTAAEAWADRVFVANGSAKRTEKAPGYLDERAEGFDAAVRESLVAPHPAGLRAVDEALATELWADLAALPELADALEGATLVSVDYDDAPYGVQYWVVRWQTP